MVEHLRQVYGPDLVARTQELRMTQHEVLTLASVIEKESGSNGEREEIAAVFHNRLKKRIPLQSDPTVIYGLPNYDGNIHKKDLMSPSPYNTYRIAGAHCEPGHSIDSCDALSLELAGAVLCVQERRHASVFGDARGA